MIDFESACPWGRENRAGQGRRAKPMLDCMGESEDAVPATIRSVIQGCGEFGINHLELPQPGGTRVRLHFHGYSCLRPRTGICPRVRQSSIDRPMRLRLKPLALIALCVTSALAITACGGGRSHKVAPGAVAAVSKKPISKSDFDHWLNVVVATQQAPGSKTKPKVPKPGSSQYDQLTRQVMQFLVSAQWIDGEAAERGITGTPAEVKRQFTQTKSQSFPTTKAYNDFLKRSGQSQGDIMYRVRLDLLANKLRQDITKGVSNVSDSSIQ